MPWAMGLLLFTMAIVPLTFSLRTNPDAFSEAGAVYGAVSENTVRFGKLLIGSQSTVSNKDVQTSALRSVEFDGRQLNEEAKLQRLGSFVECSNDSMILRVPGPRMPHFLVDRGEESPVPLSEMPASCGFSLKRVRRDVSLVAPYQGCHVRQQGGHFILPLIIMGTPAQMSCPVSSCLPAVSCFSSGMTVTLGVRTDDVKVRVDGSWQPLILTLSQCSFTLETTDGSLVLTAPFTGSCLEVTNTEWQLPLMYGDQEMTLSCPLAQPTTPAPTTPAVRDPNMQLFDPFPFRRPWWYPPYPGVPATLPPVVPPTTTPLPYPMYPRPIFDPYFFSKRDPAAPPAPQPQSPWYLKFPPMYGFRSPVEVTTPAVTTPATTTTTPAPYWPQKPYQGFPVYPPLYGYQPIKSFVPPAQYPFMPVSYRSNLWSPQVSSQSSFHKS